MSEGKKMNTSIHLQASVSMKKDRKWCMITSLLGYYIGGWSNHLQQPQSLLEWGSDGFPVITGAAVTSGCPCMFVCCLLNYLVNHRRECVTWLVTCVSHRDEVKKKNFLPQSKFVTSSQVMKWLQGELAHWRWEYTWDISESSYGRQQE